MMPAHFGSRPLARATGHYHDVTHMAITYLTDRRKLASYLPAPFRVAKEPLVTVVYAVNRQVDWLAGRGYNLIGVNAAAVFEGEVDRLEGQYALVMWENLTDPILTGRELQGIPKIYADIPDHSIVEGRWRVTASHFGHKIVDMAISNLSPLTPEQIARGKKDVEGKDHWMGWRYIPAVGGWGEGSSVPTVFPIEQTTRAAWVGEGEVVWQHLTWEENPTQFHIVNALADLPIREYRLAVVAQGSSNLRVPDRPPRTIR